VRDIQFAARQMDIDPASDIPSSTSFSLPRKWTRWPMHLFDWGNSIKFFRQELCAKIHDISKYLAADRDQNKP